MHKSCFFHTAKYTLCFIHFFVFVLSTIILAVGIWTSVDKLSLLALFEITDLDELNRAVVIDQIGYLMVGLGAVLVVYSFLGAFGAIRESRCLLLMFGLLSILLLLTEVGLLCFGYFYQETSQKIAKNYMRESLLTYHAGDKANDIVTLTWDKFMIGLNCCGVDSYLDFDISTGWLEQKRNQTIPQACCMLKNVTDIIPLDSECTNDPNETNSFYNVGCYEMMIDWLVNNREFIFFGILCMDIGILFTTFLAFFIWNSVRRIQRLRL